MTPIGRGLSTGSKWAAFPYPFTGLNKSHPKSRDCEKEWVQAVRRRQTCIGSRVSAAQAVKGLGVAKKASRGSCVIRSFDPPLGQMPQSVPNARNRLSANMHVGLAGALVVGRSTTGLCSADGKARAKALGKAYPSWHHKFTTEVLATGLCKDRQAHPCGLTSPRSFALFRSPSENICYKVIIQRT